MLVLFSSTSMGNSEVGILGLSQGKKPLGQRELLDEEVGMSGSTGF